MKVLRARICGYCMGVRRAMQLAEREVARSAGKLISLGPLIHNPVAVANLESRGLRVASEQALPESLEGYTVLVRAHGIAPEVRARLEARHASFVDATCPRVLASQQKAKRHAQEGARIILVGDKNHGEIVSITGFAADPIVVASPEEAAGVAASLAEREPDRPVVVLAQTTISPQEYGAVCVEIRRFFPEALVLETICPATLERQQAVAELCAQVEAMVIVGGRSSANTRRLLDAALACGKPSWHIETAAELPAELARYDTVGLSAGASTPDEVIDEVERCLLALPPIA